MASIFMVEPDESGGRAVNRMSHVVHGPGIAIVPGRRNFYRALIVFEERTAQFAARLFLEDDPHRMLDQQESQGVRECAFPCRGRPAQLARILLCPMYFVRRI